MMSSVEKKLADYRANKQAAERHREQWERLQDLATLGPVRRTIGQILSNLAANLTPNFQDKRQSKTTTTTPDSATETKNEPEPWTTIDYFIVAVEILLWLSFYTLAVSLEFGAIYFIVSIGFLIWFKGLSDGRSDSDAGPSAYSVFNPDFKTLDGTLTAEQFDKQIRHRNHL